MVFPRSLDFSSCSNDELEQLALTCDAATFGLNDQDVLDPTYRKAGKLDTTCFASKFDPVHSGLLDVLHDILLEGHGAEKRIRAELYKLNVYGTRHT